LRAEGGTKEHGARKRKKWGRWAFGTTPNKKTKQGEGKIRAHDKDLPIHGRNTFNAQQEDQKKKGKAGEYSATREMQNIGEKGHKAKAFNSGFRVKKERI